MEELCFCGDWQEWQEWQELTIILLVGVELFSLSIFTEISFSFSIRALDVSPGESLGVTLEAIRSLAWPT